MPRLLRPVAAIAAFAVLTGSTASFAAGSSTAVAASAAATAAAQNPSPAVANAQGLPSGAGFFPGAFVPVGIAVAAGILAVVLATQGNRGQGRGFSPN